jgi:hypothetical protein
MFSHDCPACSLTVTLPPLCETAPFQELAMVCPLANVHVSTQLLRVVVPPFLMVTVAPNWLEFCGEIE